MVPSGTAARGPEHVGRQQHDVSTSDVNRKQKNWYTKKIPIPNRY